MDQDGFDAEQRRNIELRFVALEAQRNREALVASHSPIELARHDLAAMLEFRGQYEAGATVFPINPGNTTALNNLIEELRRHAESLEQG